MGRPERPEESQEVWWWKVYTRAVRMGRMGTRGDFSEADSRPVSSICRLRKGAKIEAPSLWPDSLLSLPFPDSNWQCEGSHANMCEHPSWDIWGYLYTSFLQPASLESRGLYPRVVSVLRRTTWGRGPHRTWKQGWGKAFGQGISGFQGPGAECKRGRMLVWFWVGTFPWICRPLSVLRGHGFGEARRRPSGAWVPGQGLPWLDGLISQPRSTARGVDYRMWMTSLVLDLMSFGGS